MQKDQSSAASSSYADGLLSKSSTKASSLHSSPLTTTKTKINVQSTTCNVHRKHDRIDLCSANAKQTITSIATSSHSCKIHHSSQNCLATFVKFLPRTYLQPASPSTNSTTISQCTGIQTSSPHSAKQIFAAYSSTNSTTSSSNTSRRASKNHTNCGT